VRRGLEAVAAAEAAGALAVRGGRLVLDVDPVEML